MDSKGVDLPGQGHPLLTQTQFDRRETPAVEPVAETAKGVFRRLDPRDGSPCRNASAVSLAKRQARQAGGVLAAYLDMSDNVEVAWTVNKDTGMFVVEVRDKTTGEVLRQIPLAEIASAAGDSSLDPSGLLFDKTA